MKDLVLIDHHHQGLTRSLIHLFEDRLGYRVVRPIGLSWFEAGLWALGPHPDTAAQYLSTSQSFLPPDGTSPLNRWASAGAPDWFTGEPGTYLVADPATPSRPHVAVELDWIRSLPAGSARYVIASVPQHLGPHAKLAAELGATFIAQAGNTGWDLRRPPWSDHPVLASLMPRPGLEPRVCWYGQEFDTSIFSPRPLPDELSWTPPRGDGWRPTISSFVNVLRENGAGWRSFHNLEACLPEVDFFMFGGQNRDGCPTDLRSLSAHMRAATLGLHVKEGGDGWGHSIFQLAAVGRPLIVRGSQYAGQLGSRLLVPGQTCVDLDSFAGIPGAAAYIRLLLASPSRLAEMSQAMADRFASVVDFSADAERVRSWLAGL